MRKHRLRGLIVALAILIAACEKPMEAIPADEHRAPVVVFIAFEDDALLRDIFLRYGEESGVRVIVRNGSADDIVNDVVENKISPPADLLVTGSVSDVWRAAEEGALRPLRSNVVGERVPQWLRDPDDYWVALSYQTAVLAYNPDVFVEPDLAGVELLRAAQFHEQLCLSSSANPINRAVIAMLIAESGVRDTQNLVRGWMANLAQPVFTTDNQLLAAIDAGDCGVGIVSSHAVAQTGRGDTDARFGVYALKDVYAGIEAIGVARHAHNPNGATALVEWMLGKEIQKQYVSKTLSLAAGEAVQHARNVSLVAWHEDEAIKLAERVQYH